MRLIDADALLKNKFEVIDYGDPIEVVEVSDIDDAHTIEAEPVRHGKWERPTKSKIARYCSLCGTRHVSGSANNFCPKCGAKMVGGEVNNA